MDVTQSDELNRKRDKLAQARRETQAKVASVGVAGMLMINVFRGDLWWIAVPSVVGIGLVIRWIAQYRRLRAELGLQNEYDELDENATMGAKTLLILFGVFGGMFLLIALLVSVLGKR